MNFSSLKVEKEEAAPHSVVGDNDGQNAMDLNGSGPLCGQGTIVCPQDLSPGPVSLARDFIPSNNIFRKVPEVGDDFFSASSVLSAGVIQRAEAIQ